MTEENFAVEQARKFIERIERLEEEKAAIAADIKEVYAEAKALGFDVKAMRKVVALRKRDPEELEELGEYVRLYWAAIDPDGEVPFWL